MPIGCVHCGGSDVEAVWNHRAHFARTEIVSESHFIVAILRCGRCGEPHASVFCERVDWHGGNDPQHSLLIPVTPAEADVLVAAGERVEAELSRLGARRYLARDYPSDRDQPALVWVTGPIVVPPHE
jgi:hypothetical protein